MILDSLQSKKDSESIISIFDISPKLLREAIFHTQNNRTLVHILCGLNRADILEHVLESVGPGSHSLFLQDLAGHTPLHVAAAHSLECVRKLREMVPVKYHKELLMASDNQDLLPIMISLSQTWNPVTDSKPEAAANETEVKDGALDETPDSTNTLGQIFEELAMWMFATEGCDLESIKIKATGENLVHLACRNGKIEALEVMLKLCRGPKFDKMVLARTGAGRSAT
jgi:ankyrin repeat protein